VEWWLDSLVAREDGEIMMKGVISQLDRKNSLLKLILIMVNIVHICIAHFKIAKK
jgi:hypothetical protein